MDNIKMTQQVAHNFFTFGNIFVFAFVLLLTIVAVVYGNLKSKAQTEKEQFLDYLIMGRRLTLPLFVGSLVATWYGGIFGVTQIAFESGIYNFITQGLFWYFAYIIFALFIVSKVKEHNAVTLPEMVGKMFGAKSAKLAAIFNLFNVIPIAYTISIGFLINMFLGIGFIPSMVMGTVFVLLYSLIGGFRSVVFSDLIQFVVMFLSVLTVLLFSYFKFGGLSFLQSNLPATHFSPTGGHSIGSTLVWGFIALSTLVDPNFHQRCFAAKDSSTAKKGIFISTIIWFFFDICTTAGAMYARALMPSANPQDAYMLYSLKILPNYLQGFFIAGMAATIISTLDSYLFLSGTTIAYDLLPKKYGEKTYVHRISTVFVAILSIALAVAFKGNIKMVWKILGSYSASCLLLPILYGHLFPRTISDRQFVITSLCSAATTTIWITSERSGFFGQVDAIYIGAITSIIALKISSLYNTRYQRSN